MPKKIQLSFPYMVDKRLCVGYGVYGRVGYMVFPFNVILDCSKKHFTLHSNQLSL